MKHLSIIGRLRRSAKSRRNYIQHDDATPMVDDATPLWMELLIVIVITPLLLPAAVYAGLKWFFTVPFKLNYPKSDEQKRFILTQRYLADCKKYRKADIFVSATLPE